MNRTEHTARMTHHTMRPAPELERGHHAGGIGPRIARPRWIARHLLSLRPPATPVRDMEDAGQDNPEPASPTVMPQDRVSLDSCAELRRDDGLWFLGFECGRPYATKRSAVSDRPRGESIMAGKFELFQDSVGKYRFRLKAGNGEIVATGEAYESRSAAKKGIQAVQRAAAGATVIDQTQG